MTTNEQYQLWLDTTYYQEEDLLEKRDVTNRELLARPTDERPVEWLNPWTLSQEDIDKMRQDFKGGYKKWRSFVEKHIPFLNPETEGKLKRDTNKQEDVKRCGKPMTWTDKKGLLHQGTYLCKHYDICPTCQKMKETEHRERLVQLRGTQFCLDQKRELVAKYGKENTYSFMTASGHEITVVNTDEVIEGADKVETHTLKMLSEIIVTGHRTSGMAGKSPSPSKEKVETRQVTVQSVFLPEDKKEEVELAYLEKVKKFQPTSLDNYVEVLKRCNSLFLASVKEVCGEIHFLGKKVLIVTEGDLDWTERNIQVEKMIERLKLMVQV